MTVPPTFTKLSKFWAGSSGCLTGNTWNCQGRLCNPERSRKSSSMVGCLYPTPECPIQLTRGLFLGRFCVPRGKPIII